MANLQLVRPAPQPELLRRIRFDRALEAEAFRRLAELDLASARECFARLVDPLDFSPGEIPGAAVVALLEDILQRVNRRLNRPLSDDTDYQARRVEILLEFARFDSPEEARRAFMPMLTRLLGPLRERDPVSHPVVEKAQAYIEDNYQRRLSLSSIARQLHVSPNYLSRLFRKVTGTTLTGTIHAVRLEHARLLLAAGGHSISEIAYMVGYQNYRDFYRNFVKYEHTSPRQARRTLVRPTDAIVSRGFDGEPR